MTTALVILCVAVIVAGATDPKPPGWWVLSLAVVALLVAVTHPHFLP